jgi:5-methylthioribose kinase
MDLTTEAGTLTYLSTNTSFDAESIEPLKGGWCNFTWRVNLKTPFDGEKSVILKHAEPFAQYNVQALLDVERITYEYKALNSISETGVTDSNSIVIVPKVLHFDASHHMLIMQDGHSLPTLKEFMSSQPPPSPSLSSQIGTALGEFIANLHELGRTKNNNSNLHTLLSNNSIGRKVGHRAFYASIVPRAVEYGIEDPVLEEVADVVGQEVLTSEETLLMGDFWPGNILVDVSSSISTEGTGIEPILTLRKLWILDWEMCRYGFAATDVGVFAGESYWLSKFRDFNSAEALRRSFLIAYAKMVSKVDVARVAIQMGTHWVAWTKMVGWGSDEETEECVKKGVEYIREGWKGNEEWLANSLAKELMK